PHWFGETSSSDDVAGGEPPRSPTDEDFRNRDQREEHHQEPDRHLTRAIACGQREQECEQRNGKSPDTGRQAGCEGREENDDDCEPLRDYAVEVVGEPDECHEVQERDY